MSTINTQAAVVTTVAASATVVTLVAASAGGKRKIIFNDSTVALYIKFGTAASLTDWTDKVAIGARWEAPTPMYGGIITGIWDAAPSGQARITTY